MGKEAVILIYLGVFCLRVCFAPSVNMSNTDNSSLLALKTHINSDILAKNWSQETWFCTWIGVTCSQRHQRVTALDLSSMGLRGTIAREIGNLTFLTFLDISNNNINGRIPGEIGNLRHLRVLDMALNQLSDLIPQSLGLLKKLEGLNLSNNDLRGYIPRSLSACVGLKIFDMSNNNLSGNIPTGFGNLSQRQELSLKMNQFTGEMPSTIFNICSLLSVNVGYNDMFGSIPKDICSQPAAKLERLGLFFNQFEGEIPSALVRCHFLKVLSVAGNKFTGNIPPSIGNLSNLVLFNIGENSLYGTIPSEIGQLSSLTWLNLQENKLNGEVPQSIFNLSSLRLLSLSHNNLSGNIPLSIDQGLPNIERIFLGNSEGRFNLLANQFHGKIPNSISNLSKLTVLDLSSNAFSGDIPITLGNLHQLQILNLAFNQFTNNLSKPEQDFLSSLATCKYLSSINISSNPITGVLPKSLGLSNLSVSLETFKAFSCRILSPIPDEMGNLSNLLWLNLAYNHFTGAIPATLGRLRNLQLLEIHANRFQGSISHVLCNLKNLGSVNLALNNFFGQLPRCLGNLSSLREIKLAHKAFNSSIASTLWSNEWILKIDFSSNMFHGSLSREIGNMKNLIELDLSENQLSGEIPSTISQLPSLISMSLSNNKLDGPISESFTDLKGLEYLDLSHNKLSGPIPKSLEALQYLSHFDVSFNDLSGEIPDRGPFVNFTAEFFYGNNGLCGAPRFKLKECKLPRSSSKNKLLKYTLPAITFVLVVVALILRSRARKSSPSSSELMHQVISYRRISYLEILRATGNLDEENLIGRGCFGLVYRGKFSDAMVAAVKVFDLDVQGALKSFDTECRILRSIRHRNLVRVITCCSSSDFKALVMEYMPNGNLEKWLYSANYSLDIVERLGIMIDVAYAIEYLHEGYTFPIVHCDLKPNNILLDEDMVAHVGDFGIAKLLTQEQRMHQTRTLGTIGYIAPEYGSEGLISTMVDVYSYGVLLMELFSRRKPTDEMFSDELTMRRWVSESFLDSFIQIVDDELLNMDDESVRSRHESCLRSVIELALECTADMPEARPTMREVLERIRNIKVIL